MGEQTVEKPELNQVDNDTGLSFSTGSAELTPNPLTVRVERMNDLNQATSRMHSKLNDLNFISLMGFLGSLERSDSKQTKKML